MSIRNYKREYALYQSSPKAIAQRSARNKARREMEKLVGEAAIRGKDIDHKRPLSKGGSNNLSNLRVRSVHSNRGDKSMVRRKLA
jgi:hypothetical protein